MRTIKELLQVMLDNQPYTAGLCHWISRLAQLDIITTEEFWELSYYIRLNRPSRYSSLKAYKNRHKSYYWPQYDLEPRIKWIKKHIKLN